MMVNPKSKRQPTQRRNLLDPVEIEGGRLAYPVPEFARRVGVGKSSIFVEIKLGRLKSVRRCARRLILHEDGIEWLRDGYESGKKE
jgi:hypothetical protein